MGLGDNGVEGIQQFCDQHQCNSVCKALDLPDLRELLPTLFSNITNHGAPLFDTFQIEQALICFLSQMALSLREALSYLHLTYIPSRRNISPKGCTAACLSTRASHHDCDTRLNLKTQRYT
jgi:hypothetical protein